MKKENYGIYIHFPFCRRKCLYCDFYSLGGRDFDWVRFAQAVEREYKYYGVSKDAVVTLYLGGGTPSLAPVEVVSGFRNMIDNEIGEFTIEVNPDDVTEEKASGWKEAGVNRVSMGVQSLVDRELRNVGRRHTAEEAVRAYNILRKHFSNISLDLMFGLPGQTKESLAKTINGFREMRPEHISAYSLMYEERSALTRLLKAGKIEETAEEDSVEMFRMISSFLRESGYERYEISNYSLPGFRSHHNSNYWAGVPYIGLGPSAHSYDGEKLRRYNAADLSVYLNVWGGEEKIERLVETEDLTIEELREEMIMTRLRTVEGLDLEEFRLKFGEGAYSDLLEMAEKYLQTGNLYYRESNAISLTEEGVMISDEIISGLF